MRLTSRIYFLGFYFLYVLLLSCGTNTQSNISNIPRGGVFDSVIVIDISKQIANNPNDATLYFKRSEILRTLNGDSAAIIDLYKAISLDSNKANYYSAIGEILFERKDIEGSVYWFKKAIERDPIDPIAHLKFAKMLVFVNDNQKAFDEINTVLRRDPYNPEAYFLKGMVYKNLNDTSKALSSFQTAVQVDPLYQPAILQIGFIYATQNDDIALKYFENAYNADSTQLISLHAKAMFYQSRNKVDTAKDIYRLIIKKDTLYTDAYFNLAYLLMQGDSTQKAEILLSHIIALNPNDAETFYNRAVCRELQGDTNNALNDYQEALKLDPAYPEARKAIGRLKK